MQKNLRFGHFFIRRFLKYLLPLVLLLLLMTPLIIEAYQMTYDKSLEATKSSINETLRQFESQIVATQELSGFLFDENPFRNLNMVDGELQSRDYIYLNQAQNQLARLNLINIDAAEIFILFRDNDIFISNHISSDNFQRVYPNMLEYQDMTAVEYRELMMSSRFSTKLFPQQNIYSRYYGKGTFSGITCAVNNSKLEYIRPGSVLISIIDCETILKDLLSAEQLQSHLIFMSDQDGQTLMTHNYDALKPIPLDKVRIKVNGSTYLTVRQKSELTGLQMTVGIPLKHFYQDVFPLIKVVIVYGLAGVITALLLSLFFSFKEAKSISSLVKTAAVTAHKDYYGMKNEITFVSDTIEQMGAVNEQQLQRINSLHDSIRICALENLMVMGVYTKKEETEILKYFDRDFSFYCVIKFRALSSLLEDSSCQDSEQAFLLEVQNALLNIFNSTPLVLNLYDSEFAAIVFLDETDASSLEPVQKRLAEVMKYGLPPQSPEKIATQVVLHIGISNIATGIRNVRNAYLQSCYAINSNTDSQENEIYCYEAPRMRSGPLSFDLAIPFKLYDVIVSGDSSGIEQIFSEIKKTTDIHRLSQQEQAQLFFTLRQAIYNAYVEAARNSSVDNKIYAVQFSDFRIDAPMSQQLNELYTVANEIRDIIIRGRKNIAQRMKSKLESYIRENYSDQGLCAETIAQKLMVSEKYVFTAIKEQTGKSLGHFIEDIRISHAEELLEGSKESNGQISLLCGFGSENTFYRAFSRRHGVSPSVWRKKQSGFSEEEQNS